jgi:hypothetical protein
MSNPYPTYKTNRIFTGATSMNKQDTHASREESLKFMHPDVRTDSEKILDRMMDERGANEQGAEPYVVLRQITLELLDQRA